MKIVNWIACIYWFITGIMMCFGYEPIPGVLIGACFISSMSFHSYATERN